MTMNKKPTLFFGLLKRKECTCPSFRGWLVAFMLVIGCGYLVVHSLYPFLAENRPVRGQVLVVEGWLPDYALVQAMREFDKYKYSLLVTTGGPVEKGFYLSEYKTFAELTSATLIKLGFSQKQLLTVSAPAVLKDRTYTSAFEVKKRLASSGIKVKSLDVFSFGPHSRRTRMLFQRALGNSIRVGVISSESLDFDARYWFMSSAGFRTTIDEAIAYLYAKFLFWKK
jgi:hypothetical protein